MSKFLLAIDQGTTSSRAIVFDSEGRIVSVAQQEFAQIFPEDGWVEHDPEDIWISTLQVVKEALESAGKKATEITAIGITNQRETTVVWDRKTGKPVYNAIVWQDRRTARYCQQNKTSLEPLIQKKTGLLLDPYFSATKLRWILDEVPGVRVKAEAGELAFGTIDSFLLWRLSGEKSHKTDATNASRTMLFNIHTQEWDRELLEVFTIPESLLPEVEDCVAQFGFTEPDLFGAAIAVTGMAGDQQAALVGQACFKPNMVKSTFGTGCFLMQNTGTKAVQSSNRLLTTVAYRIGGETTYAIEGSIFVAGAAIQWLRDGLSLIDSASETESIATQTIDAKGVYLVPAFTGLGAPYWDPDARGAILGLTRDTGIGEVVTAGLQSVCYQVADLLLAMRADGCSDLGAMRVDGGMVVNNWLVQFLSDILSIKVDRPEITETTALGVAYLAGIGAGVYSGIEEVGKRWQAEKSFSPGMEAVERDKLYQGWKRAVERVKSRS